MKYGRDRGTAPDDALQPLRDPEGNASRGTNLDRAVLGDERVADFLLQVHDLAPVSFERESVTHAAEPFTLT